MFEFKNILTNHLITGDEAGNEGFQSFFSIGRRLVRICTGGLMLCAVCSCAYAAGIRVASLNLDKKFGPGIVSKIAAQDDLRRADVLLLQEIVDGPESRVAAEVAAKLGLHSAFEPAFQLDSRFVEGLAILSRFPMSAPDMTRLSHNDVHFHTRKRIVMAVTVETPNGPVRIVNTHLDNRINQSAKLVQLKEVQLFIGSYTGPCIIGGDFNTGNFRWYSHVLPVPGVQSLNAVLDKSMREQGFQTPLGAGPGTLHFLGLKLDWIYLRGLTALDSGVTPIDFSDHNSVWVTFER